MENKTVLEQAIATIQSSLDSYRERMAKEPFSAYLDGICTEKSGTITLLKNLLPTEKQQIVDAYEKGWDNGFDIKESSPETYYNETFNKGQ